MNLFSRMIKCVHCGRNFKAKKERGKRVYVCSTYDNYGKEKCRRVVIAQEMLIELLVRRYGEEFEVTKQNIKNTVKRVEVEDRWLFKIELFDDNPIVFEERYVQF